MFGITSLYKAIARTPGNYGCQGQGARTNSWCIVQRYNWRMDQFALGSSWFCSPGWNVGVMTNLTETLVFCPMYGPSWFCSAQLAYWCLVQYRKRAEFARQNSQCWSFVQPIKNWADFARRKRNVGGLPNFKDELNFARSRWSIGILQSLQNSQGRADFARPS